MIWYGQNEMKTLLTTTSVVVAAALALGVGPASVTKDAEAAWKPKQPVELVIMARKGSGPTGWRVSSGASSRKK